MIIHLIIFKSISQSKIMIDSRSIVVYGKK